MFRVSDQYWLGRRQSPAIWFRGVPTESERIEARESGTADLVTQISPASGEKLKQSKGCVLWGVDSNLRKGQVAKNPPRGPLRLRDGLLNLDLVVLRVVEYEGFDLQLLAFEDLVVDEGDELFRLVSRQCRLFHQQSVLSPLPERTGESPMHIYRPKVRNMDYREGAIYH